jgi:hypothetical protein
MKAGKDASVNRRKLVAESEADMLNDMKKQRHDNCHRFRHRFLPQKSRTAIEKLKSQWQPWVYDQFSRT